MNFRPKHLFLLFPCFIALVSSDDGTQSSDDLSLDTTDRTAALYFGKYYYEQLVINEITTGYDPSTLPFNPISGTNKSLSIIVMQF
jgi:hypothetical protein